MVSVLLELVSTPQCDDALIFHWWRGSILQVVFFFFLAATQPMEVPGLGIRINSKPQLQPTLGATLDT